MPPLRVTFTGGHVNAKLNVNVYCDGEHAQISSSTSSATTVVERSNNTRNKNSTDDTIANILFLDDIITIIAPTRSIT